MSRQDSKSVEATLQTSEIHLQWSGHYRTAENESFYDQVFDYLQQVLNPPEGSCFLDIGCGSGAHSIRLAARGYSVLGTDFSEEILTVAQQKLKERQLEHKVNLQREDLLDLSFKENSFNYILCWGVLMHIPEVETAISELCRVLNKGGILVISEGNMRSLQSILLRWLKRFGAGTEEKITRTDAGLEHWRQTSSGMLLSREADIVWLKQKFAQQGVTVEVHLAGQFSELYYRFSTKWVRTLVHRCNDFWFNCVKMPGPAFGNILILKKQE